MPTQEQTRPPVTFATGRQLKAARIVAGFSQDEAAVHSGISTSTLRRAEVGRSELRWSTVCRLASFYGVEVYDLVSEEPTSEPETAVA